MVPFLHIDNYKNYVLYDPVYKQNANAPPCIGTPEFHALYMRYVKHFKYMTSFIEYPHNNAVRNKWMIYKRSDEMSRQKSLNGSCATATGTI